MVTCRSSPWSAARPASARPACCASSPPPRPPTSGCSTAQAQPGSIGRPFHAVAPLTPDADPATGPHEAVREAAAAGRAVLLVEDLHWADADSVAVLDAITQSPWPHLMVLGTYRPSDLSRGSPGGELVLRLERRHAVEQVRLERLDRGEVGAMLSAIMGRPTDSAAVEAVHRRSAGIPFVVEELVRAAPDDCQDDLASARLPWSLDEAVRQQVAGLAPGERRVVEALSVFGRPTSFDALASMASLDEAALLDALRPLVARGVIVEPADDLFWFGHALVAEVVVHQLLGRERRSLHERAAAVLREQPDPDAAALAAHLHGAGHYDEVVEIARSGARDYLAAGQLVPGPAPGRAGAGRGARRRRAAGGRDRGRVAPRLQRGGARLRRPLGRALAGRRRRDRRPAPVVPPAPRARDSTTSSTPGGSAWSRSRPSCRPVPSGPASTGRWPR